MLSLPFRDMEQVGGMEGGGSLLSLEQLKLSVVATVLARKFKVCLLAVWAVVHAVTIRLFSAFRLFGPPQWSCRN
jgi:hypothetical protein